METRIREPENAPSRHRATPGRHRKRGADAVRRFLSGGERTSPDYNKLVRERSERLHLRDEEMTVSNRKPLLSWAEAVKAFNVYLGDLQAIVYPQGEKTPLFCFDRSARDEHGYRIPDFLILTDEQLQRASQGRLSDEETLKLSRGDSFTLKQDRRAKGAGAHRGGVEFSANKYYDPYGNLFVEDMGGSNKGTTVLCNKEFAQPGDPWLHTAPPTGEDLNLTPEDASHIAPLTK